MYVRCWSAALLALVYLGSLVSAAEYDPAARAATIAPFMDDQTVAVGYADVRRIDVGAIMKTVDAATPLLRDLPADETQKAQAKLTEYVANLRKAGCQEVFLVVSLADVPARMPFLVITTGGDSDPLAIEKLLFSGPEGNITARPTDISLEKVKGQLVLGHTATLARLKGIAAAARPELAKAFAMVGDAALQGVLVPSDDSRRVISELVPPLPKELGEVTGQDLVDGVRYGAISIDLPPTLSLRLAVQSKDAASATKLKDFLIAGMAFLSDNPRIEEFAPKFAELAKVLVPKQDGDKLSVQLTEENGGVAKVLTLLTPPVQAARAAAQRAQSMNNLKQLALAMHNYHDTYGHFPAAQSGKDGKPLLSWRVQILPFIEQAELYKQFKLDEPWDSDHNRKLIDKMPKLYASPGIKLAPGKTTYLVPTGEKMAFHADRKTKFASIVDGTSNTLMIVEADADKGVDWTKPDDLPIDLDKPMSGLGKAHAGGFLAAFCDGSVRFISEKIDPKVLAGIFTMNGGEVVDLP